MFEKGPFKIGLELGKHGLTGNRHMLDECWVHKQTLRMGIFSAETDIDQRGLKVESVWT